MLFRSTMNLFQCGEDCSEDDGLSQAQKQKKIMRKRMSQVENEPIFKGKVNLSIKELEKGDEFWLVRVPKNVSAIELYLPLDL